MKNIPKPGVSLKKQIKYTIHVVLLWGVGGHYSMKHISEKMFMLSVRVVYKGR